MSDNEKPNYDSAKTTLALNSEAPAAVDPMQAAEARMRRALGLDGEQLRARAPQERADSPQRTMERFSAPGHKRRFVHDGEVPVTLVHGLVSGRREQPDGNGARGGSAAQPTNRLEVAEAALAAEIATRERVERALAEAQAAVHDLRTKLGHADLARQEAVETLRREREAAAGLRGELLEARAQVALARQTQEEAVTALAELRERQAAVVADVMHEDVVDEDVVDEPPRPRRGRKPRAAVQAAPEPVVVPSKLRKGPGRPRSAAPKPAKEPKPIRWWLAPRTKKKR